MRVESQEKDELWADIDNEALNKGLDVKYLIFAYVFLCIALLICVPKIYLSNSVYYLSREINKLQTQSDLLKEENRRLQNEREMLRYGHLN